MAISIDLDRPFLMRKAASMNMKIFMYFDTPGVYLNVHGAPVSIALAEKAGFDTKKWAKAKLKNDKMAEFKAKIEAELEMEPEDENEEIVLKEAGGMKIVQRPLGLADVYDADGEKLNDKSITVVEAELLLDLMLDGGESGGAVSAKPSKSAKAKAGSENAASAE